MATWQDRIQQIHNGPHQLVMAVTGGGSLAVSDLLTCPGASSTVLEAVVPYCSRSLDEWLGVAPEHYCARETALAMATTAWWRARQLACGDDAPGSLLGVACTAALASDRPRRGTHRCHVAVESDQQSTLHTLSLEKGCRGRAGEEALVRCLILKAIGEAAGLSPGPPLDLTGQETLLTDSQRSPAEIADVRCGKRNCVWSPADGGLSGEPGQPVAGLLSGSFNPLHDGHRELRRVAERILGGTVAYELPVVNADKPPLDFFSIALRRTQFGSAPLAVTATSRFVDKARVFPGTAFVVGVDTVARILQPRFYGGSARELMAALDAIRLAGCHFLVAGRQVNGEFRCLGELNLPAGFEEMFTAVPESQFRQDVSSTEIRSQAD